MMRRRLASGVHINVGRLAKALDVEEVVFFVAANFRSFDMSEAFRLRPLPKCCVSWEVSLLSTTVDLSNLKSVFFLELQYYKLEFRKTCTLECLRLWFTANKKWVNIRRLFHELGCGTRHINVGRILDIKIISEYRLQLFREKNKQACKLEVVFCMWIIIITITYFSLHNWNVNGLAHYQNEQLENFITMKSLNLRHKASRWNHCAWILIKSKIEHFHWRVMSKNMFKQQEYL